MAVLVSNRAEIKREFYRLTGTSAADGALSEHEANAGETLNRYIQYGLREAQSWYLNNVDPNRWLKTTSTLTWSGAESTDGGRYYDLPADFLRLYAKSDMSAIRQPSGERWGALIDPEVRHIRGNYYYVNSTYRSGDTTATPRLWITRGAAPPSNAVLDYNYEHAEIQDDAEAIDFPPEDILLVGVYAAWLAAEDALLPGGDAMRARIDAKRVKLEKRIYLRGRRTREPRRRRPQRPVGRKWIGWA